MAFLPYQPCSRSTGLQGSCLSTRSFPLPLPQGVTWRRFLVLLHHTPGKYSRRGLEDAMGVCSGYSIECRWAGMCWLGWSPWCDCLLDAAARAMASSAGDPCAAADGVVMRRRHLQPATLSLPH